MQRRVGEGDAASCITSTVNQGGGRVIVWEAFAIYKVKDLYQVKGKLNQTGHHRKLPHHAIQFEIQPEVQGFVLMQNNNPKHTSKFCQRYIKSKKE